MSLARNPGTFLYNNKFAIALASLNLGATVFDHFWAATSDSYSLTWKILYMGVVPLLRTGMWGVMGHGVDVSSKMLDRMTTETSPLLQSRV